MNGSVAEPGDEQAQTVDGGDGGRRVGRVVRPPARVRDVHDLACPLVERDQPVRPVRLRAPVGDGGADDDEVAVGYDHPRLVLQRRRHALDEVEEAVAARGNVCAVLDVVGLPIPLSRRIVPLIEQRVEGLKDQCLIPLLCRLTHNDLLTIA